MLKTYRKEHRKIAMGLLSFHDHLSDSQHVLYSLERYETDDNLRLYLWQPEGGSNIQGIVGVEELPDRLVLHDVSIVPSYRGEGAGFEVLDQLKELYPEQTLVGTPNTAAFLAKWRDRSRKG